MLSSHRLRVESIAFASHSYLPSVQQRSKMTIAFAVPIPLSSPRHTRPARPSRQRTNPVLGASSSPPTPPQPPSRNIHLSRSRRPRAAAERVQDVVLRDIRRPLAGTRSNDADKVARLAESIAREGLHVPIDVLEVDGVFYGFSGCHRFEAHQRLGLETIRCRVYPATEDVLRRHLA